ncbi:MAG: zf-HC2 domain-containing protein [Myxococcales bacterium]|nr:zf-HC2 domain-containing protein [Myxococcales bacterium]
MLGERVVGGKKCSEVLGLLSRYLDGDLDADEHRWVVTHVEGCAACASFGSRFAEAIARLREEAAREGLPEGVGARLKARLRSAQSG